MIVTSKAAVAAIVLLGVGAGGIVVATGGIPGLTVPESATKPGVTKMPVTIRSVDGSHVFTVETAKTEAEQARGLMYRTDLKPDDGMLFWPYPPAGGAPREANFWMKNTPTPLDIVYIRADGTIARIAENTAPFSETPIPSGEPVAAVLEIVGGRSAELGIGEGDRVNWAGRSK